MDERVKSKLPEQALNTETALDEINYIKQQIAILGVNDYEFSAIDEIIERVTRGEFEGRLQDAIGRAMRIMKSKADYK